jgi:hypothetical protein
MTWHAPPEALTDWVSGASPETAAAAIEAHLVRCAECRARAAALPQPEADLEAVWTRVADAVESTAPNALTKVMRAVGVREPDSIVLRAAPAYTAAWSVAVAVTVALTVAAAMVDPDRMLGVYLLLAPLVPMAGVAAGYGPAADPTYELAVAAPYPKLKILLLRGAAVLLGSIPVTCAVGALLDPWWVAVAWIAPGLTAVLVLLAALTWVAPIRAAGGVAAAWTAAFWLAILNDDQLILVGHVAMSVFAAASVASLAVFLARSRLLAVAPRVGGL